jgi:hypothetical protein
MCPEYIYKSVCGWLCPFIAAYDVFSIGVVMAELILGRLNLERVKIFQKYVMKEQTEIVDGWKLLKDDADGSIIWNPKALQIVCNTAIKCMAPSPGDRLRTNDLLNVLYSSILVHNGTFDSAPMGAGCDVVCRIDGCSSEPFQDEDLRKLLSVEIYTRSIARRGEQTRMNDLHQLEILEKTFHRIDESVHGVKQSVDATYGSLQEQQEMLQNLQKKLDRSLAALSWLAANIVKGCPNLVWVTPMSVEKNYLRNPKNWIRDAVKQKFKVVFICAHSGEAGHNPFEISVPRGWIAQVAPWLKLCLRVLKSITNSQDLPFPIPGLPFSEQCDRMNTFFDSLIKEGTEELLSRGETLLENGTVTNDKFGLMQELAGGAFKMIAEKAKKDKRSHLWMPPVMVPVLNGNGTIMWVKGEYQDHYRVSID